MYTWSASNAVAIPIERAEGVFMYGPVVNVITISTLS